MFVLFCCCLGWERDVYVVLELTIGCCWCLGEAAARVGISPSISHLNQDRFAPMYDGQRMDETLQSFCDVGPTLVGWSPGL